MSVLGLSDFVLRENTVLVIVAAEYGNFKAKPPELVRVEGVDYTDFQLVEVRHTYGCAQTQSCFLGREAKSPQEIAAEEAVKKAESALAAAKCVLKTVKEK